MSDREHKIGFSIGDQVVFHDDFPRARQAHGIGTIVEFDELYSKSVSVFWSRRSCVSWESIVILTHIAKEPS